MERWQDVTVGLSEKCEDVGRTGEDEKESGSRGRWEKRETRLEVSCDRECGGGGMAEARWRTWRWRSRVEKRKEKEKRGF